MCSLVLTYNIPSRCTFAVFAYLGNNERSRSAFQGMMVVTTVDTQSICNGKGFFCVIINITENVQLIDIYPYMPVLQDLAQIWKFFDSIFSYKNSINIILGMNFFKSFFLNSNKWELIMLISGSLPKGRAYLRVATRGSQMVCRRKDMKIIRPFHRTLSIFDFPEL